MEEATGILENEEREDEDDESGEDETNEAIADMLKADEAEARAKAKKSAAQAKLVRAKGGGRSRKAIEDAEGLEGTLFGGTQKGLAKVRIFRMMCACQEHAHAKRRKLDTVPVEELPQDEETLMEVLAYKYGPGCYRLEGVTQAGRYVSGASLKNLNVPGEPWEFEEPTAEGTGAPVGTRPRPGNGRGPVIIPPNMKPVYGPDGSLQGWQEKADEDDESKMSQFEIMQMLQAGQGDKDREREASEQRREDSFMKLMTILETKNASVMTMMTQFATAQVAAAQAMASSQVAAAKELAQGQMVWLEKQMERQAETERKPMEVMADAQAKANELVSQAAMKSVQGTFDIQKTVVEATLEQIAGKEGWVQQLQDLGIPDMAKAAIAKWTAPAGSPGGPPALPQKAAIAKTGTIALPPKEGVATEEEPTGSSAPYAHPQLGEYLAYAISNNQPADRFAALAEQQMLTPGAVLDLEKIASDEEKKPGEKVDAFVAAFDDYLNDQVRGSALTPVGRQFLFEFLMSFATESEGAAAPAPKEEKPVELPPEGGE